MNTPRFEPIPGPDDRDGYMLTSPYNEGFVAELKAMIPYRDRQWWASSKAWWIAASSFDVAVHLVRRYFGAHELIDADTGEVIHVGADGTRVGQGGLSL